VARRRLDSINDEGEKGQEYLNGTYNQRVSKQSNLTVANSGNIRRLPYLCCGPGALARAYIAPKQHRAEDIARQKPKVKLLLPYCLPAELDQRGEPSPQATSAEAAQGEDIAPFRALWEK
jgi:hypothetical protein